MFGTYIYNTLVINQKEYSQHLAVLNSSEKKSIISIDKTQRALVKQSITPSDNLLCFDIYAINEDDAIATVLLTIYTYITSYYLPGERTIRKVKRPFCIYCNKELSHKYDQSFIETITP